MKGFVSSTLLMLCLLIFLSNACARHKQVTRIPRVSEKTKNEQIFKENSEAVKAGIYEEFVDSMRLKGLAREVPETNITRETAPVSELPADITMGYRVQLGAFNDQQSAEAMAAKARSILGNRVAVYVRYYAPLWKVQAGDCQARSEADILCSSIRQIGYPDAWIVRSGVNK